MFQDIGASALARQRSEAQTRAPADEAAELIDRYPNLSEVELTRLIHVYSQLSAVQGLGLPIVVGEFSWEGLDFATYRTRRVLEILGGL